MSKQAYRDFFRLLALMLVIGWVVYELTGCCVEAGLV